MNSVEYSRKINLIKTRVQRLNSDVIVHIEKIDDMNHLVKLCIGDRSTTIFLTDEDLMGNQDQLFAVIGFAIADIT